MKLLQRTSFDWRSWLAGAALVLCFFFAQVSLAATIVVDGSTCTLPQAITAANTPTSCGTSSYAGSVDADTITFDANYTSTITPGAQINVTSDITIVGGAREINGNNNHRLFHVQSGHLRLDRLTLNNGESASGGHGGAILVNSGAALTVTNSALRDNRGAGDGGAIASSGALTVSNSSFSSNEANGSGGGGAISIKAGSATITHVIMYSNDAVGVGSKGKALLIDGSAARVYLRNSILGDEDSSSNDCGLTNNATLQQNIGNVIENGDAGCTSGTRTNIGIYSNRGSPVAITISASSHANGAGDDAICKAFPTDQSGVRRPATACDAGAAERDGFNDIYVDSACTLRQAIITAQNQSTQSQCEVGVIDDVAIDAIWLTMDANVTQSSQITVSSKILIEGQGHTISRTSGSARLFLVNSNASFTVRNATISSGTDSGDGGAFNVQGGAGIHLEDCVIKDNESTSEDGGGIYFHTSHGTSSIDRCYFSNNRAGTHGGALYINGGTVTVSNSTFEGNHSAENGGAIAVSSGTATLVHLTVWDNTSGGSGYVTGIFTDGGTTYLQNSIIGRASDQGGALCGGSFEDSNQERGIIISQTTANCPQATVADPKLGAKTGAVPYFPLSAGSPAIGLGVDAQCALYPTDQRGAARPATGCDAGAFQYIAPPREESGDDQGPPKTGGRWVQHADGSWHYVRPGEDEDKTTTVCTGEALNETGAFNVSTTYGLCNGVQFNPLEISAIGIGYVIDAGPLAAVDVWGWVTAYVEVCYRGQASALFLDAATAPRTVMPLASTWDGVWTCAQISSAGTIVFLPAQSYLTTPPVDAAAPAAPADVAPLSNCMVTLNFILNFRAAPGGDVIMILPYGIKLTAFQRSGDWVQVDYHGIRGWVSASHVTFEGDC